MDVISDLLTREQITTKFGPLTETYGPVEVSGEMKLVDMESGTKTRIYNY